VTVIPVEPPSRADEPLASRSYRINVDGGRDSFFALQIEDPEKEGAWLLSDTVRSLDEMR
jgi:hypothetical protein